MKPNRNKTDASQKKKQIIIMRLRGGTLEQCASVAGSAKSYCSKVLNAYISQIEAGLMEDFDESPDPVLRWQIARADEKEIEVQRLRRELMPVAIIKDQCARIAKHLTDTQKQLDRAFGVEAGNMVRDALQAAKREEDRING